MTTIQYIKQLHKDNPIPYPNIQQVAKLLGQIDSGHKSIEKNHLDKNSGYIKISQGVYIDYITFKKLYKLWKATVSLLIKVNDNGQAISKQTIKRKRREKGVCFKYYSTKHDRYIASNRLTSKWQQRDIKSVPRLMFSNQLCTHRQPTQIDIKNNDLPSLHWFCQQSVVMTEFPRFLYPILKLTTKSQQKRLERIQQDSYKTVIQRLNNAASMCILLERILVRDLVDKYNKQLLNKKQITWYYNHIVVDGNRVTDKQQRMSNNTYIYINTNFQIYDIAKASKGRSTVSIKDGCHGLIFNNKQKYKQQDLREWEQYILSSGLFKQKEQILVARQRLSFAIAMTLEIEQQVNIKYWKDNSLWIIPSKQALQYSIKYIGAIK